MQKGEWSEVAAIASRDLGKAETAARSLGIAKAYGSYEGNFLPIRKIEAIQNPLLNQLHVPLTIKAAEAGKHVFAGEKPLSLTVAEAKTLLAVQKLKSGTENRGGVYGAYASALLQAREVVSLAGLGSCGPPSDFSATSTSIPANIATSHI